MVLSEFAQAIHRIDARLSRLQRVGVNVRRIEKGPVVKTFLLEEDGEGIDLFAVAAARDPDLQRRIGAQMRQHLFPQRFEIGRIPEHLADLYREISQQPRQHGRVMQHRIL